jgi:GGDEF domain-containing protein
MLRASRREALSDALTGLGNRRALTRDLAELIPEAGAGSPLVLALFDLDGFKQYNDTFGHPAGDRCWSASAPTCARSSAPGGACSAWAATRSARWARCSRSPSATPG